MLDLNFRSIVSDLRGLTRGVLAPRSLADFAFGWAGPEEVGRKSAAERKAAAAAAEVVRKAKRAAEAAALAARYAAREAAACRAADAAREAADRRARRAADVAREAADRRARRAAMMADRMIERLRVRVARKAGARPGMSARELELLERVAAIARARGADTAPIGSVVAVSPASAVRTDPDHNAELDQKGDRA